MAVREKSTIALPPNSSAVVHSLVDRGLVDTSVGERTLPGLANLIPSALLRLPMLPVQDAQDQNRMMVNADLVRQIGRSIFLRARGYMPEHMTQDAQVEFINAHAIGRQANPNVVAMLLAFTPNLPRSVQKKLMATSLHGMAERLRAQATVQDAVILLEQKITNNNRRMFADPNNPKLKQLADILAADYQDLYSKAFAAGSGLSVRTLAYEVTEGPYDFVIGDVTQPQQRMRLYTAEELNALASVQDEEGFRLEHPIQSLAEPLLSLIGRKPIRRSIPAEIEALADPVEEHYAEDLLEQHGLANPTTVLLVPSQTGSGLVLIELNDLN